jgi:hypothetical protein
LCYRKRYKYKYKFLFRHTQDQVISQAPKQSVFFRSYQVQQAALVQLHLKDMLLLKNLQAASLLQGQRWYTYIPM